MCESRRSRGRHDFPRPASELHLCVCILSVARPLWTSATLWVRTRELKWNMWVTGGYSDSLLSCFFLLNIMWIADCKMNLVTLLWIPWSSKEQERSDVTHFHVEEVLGIWKFIGGHNEDMFTVMWNVQSSALHCHGGKRDCRPVFTREMCQLLDNVPSKQSWIKALQESGCSSNEDGLISILSAFPAVTMGAKPWIQALSSALFAAPVQEKQNQNP